MPSDSEEEPEKQAEPASKQVFEQHGMEEEKGDLETQMETSDDLPEPVTKAELESMRVAELRDDLKALGLNTKGKKQELVDRLYEAQSKQSLK